MLLLSFDRDGVPLLQGDVLPFDGCFSFPVQDVENMGIRINMLWKYYIGFSQGKRCFKSG
jgi:hypothetical protein